MNEQFYMHLPSNSSGKYFPNNTLSHFQTQLNSRLNLDETWEVGLSEILYNSSLPQLDGKFEENSLILNVGEETEIIYFPTRAWPSFETFIAFLMDKITNYHLGQLLMEKFLAELKKQYQDRWFMMGRAKTAEPANHIYYKNIKISFPIRQYTSIRDLMTEINSQVGAETTRNEILLAAYTFIEKQPNFFYNKIKAEGKRQIAFIYLNLITPTISGDILSKTLRIVHLNSKGGQAIFNPIYYHKLNHFSFEMVEVSMRTDKGEYINFSPSSQPTIVVLHFRRINRLQN